MQTHRKGERLSWEWCWRDSLLENSHLFPWFSYQGWSSSRRELGYISDQRQNLATLSTWCSMGRHTKCRAEASTKVSEKSAQPRQWMTERRNEQPLHAAGEVKPRGRRKSGKSHMCNTELQELCAPLGSDFALIQSCHTAISISPFWNRGVCCTPLYIFFYSGAQLGDFLRLRKDCMDSFKQFRKW